jgi:hypothetical protein
MSGAPRLGRPVTNAAVRVWFQLPLAPSYRGPLLRSSEEKT